ncbi:MAG TPA: diguanylate cyclase [Desulfobulbaceae bacterium]|nr:diguanylate cyclase [Desulfobulbaceae bacterium]
MELFNHLPCPALILHEDFTIYRANTAACTLFDNPEMEEKNIDLAAHCNQAVIKELHEALSTLKNGTPLKKTIKMHSSDGKPITVGSSLTILPDSKALLLLTEHDREQSCTPGCHKLRILEEQYQNNPAGILLVNDKMEMISYNRKFLQMWNIPESIQQNRDENKSLQTVLEQIRKPEKFLAKVYELYKNPEQKSRDEVELKDGRIFYRHSFPVYTEHIYHGRVWYFLDITSLKAAQRKIVRQQKFQRAILEHIQDGIVACNSRGQLSMFNRASREIHGCDLVQVPQEEWSQYYHLFTADGVTPLKSDRNPLVRALRGEEIHNQEMVIKSRNGDARELRTNGQAMYDNEGNKLGAVISLHDITDLNKAKKKLHHLAYHDELTGLANRRLFHDLLKQNIRRARRNMEKTAVLFLDLDNFKQINDQHGHEAGDQLLVQLAAILRLHLRDSDILCRWGGDEFLIALQEISSNQMACKVAKKICRAVENELAGLCGESGLSASIGIALYPEHGQSPDMLIRRADMAMYMAKDQGKNQFSLFLKNTFAPEQENKVSEQNNNLSR